MKNPVTKKEYVELILANFSLTKNEGVKSEFEQALKDMKKQLNYEQEQLYTLTEWIEGQEVTVLLEGSVFKRVVRYSRKNGLYIVINNYNYFEYEADYSLYYANKNKGAG